MKTKHLTLRYLKGMTRNTFEQYQTVPIVGEINARQFVNHVTHLTINSPLHGKASLYDIVQATKCSYGPVF